MCAQLPHADTAHHQDGTALGLALQPMPQTPHPKTAQYTHRLLRNQEPSLADRANPYANFLTAIPPRAGKNFGLGLRNSRADTPSSLLRGWASASLLLHSRVLREGKGFAAAGPLSEGVPPLALAAFDRLFTLCTAAYLTSHKKPYEARHLLSYQRLTLKTGVMLPRYTLKPLLLVVLDLGGFHVYALGLFSTLQRAEPDADGCPGR